MNEMISVAAILVSLSAFIFSVTTFFMMRRANRIYQANEMLFQLNRLVLQHPEVACDNPTPVEAYAAIVWNYMETTYFLRLGEYGPHTKAFKDFATDREYSTWFKNKKDKYDPDFVSFITKMYPKELT